MRHSITVEQWKSALKIINFVQSLGWEIDGMELYRFEDGVGAVPGLQEGEVWRVPKIKWGLLLRAAPRDQEELEPERDPRPL